MTYFGKQLSSRPIKYQNLSYAGSASVPSTIRPPRPVAYDKTNNAGHPAGGMPSRNDANKNIARKQQQPHRDLASVRDTTQENSAVPEQR